MELNQLEATGRYKGVIRYIGRIEIDEEDEE